MAHIYIVPMLLEVRLECQALQEKAPMIAPYQWMQTDRRFCRGSYNQSLLWGPRNEITIKINKVGQSEDLVMRVSDPISVREGMKGQWLLETQMETMKNSMLEIANQAFSGCLVILRRWVHELSAFILWERDIWQSQ